MGGSGNHGVFSDSGTIGSIGGDIFERRGIHSIVVHGIAFGPGCASCKKGTERMVGNSNDTIRHKKTDLPHGFAIKTLLEAATRGHGFIGIVNVNDPPAEPYTRPRQQIDCAHQVVVTAQNVILSPPQLTA